jgi:hypothetical protein
MKGLGGGGVATFAFVERFSEVEEIEGWVFDEVGKDFDSGGFEGVRMVFDGDVVVVVNDGEVKVDGLIIVGEDFVGGAGSDDFGNLLGGDGTCEVWNVVYRSVQDVGSSSPVYIGIVRGMARAYVNGRSCEIVDGVFSVCGFGNVGEEVGDSGKVFEGSGPPAVVMADSAVCVVRCDDVVLGNEVAQKVEVGDRGVCPLTLVEEMNDMGGSRVVEVFLMEEATNDVDVGIVREVVDGWCFKVGFIPFVFVLPSEVVHFGQDDLALVGAGYSVVVVGWGVKFVGVIPG